MTEAEVVVLEELDKRVKRMENQIAALRQSNLILLAHLGQLARGMQLAPEQLEILRGQYRAITSLAIPPNK